MTNLNDSGPGSLRNAIQTSMNDPGVVDSIVFDSSLTGTIALESELPVFWNANIQGPGADRVTVSASGITGGGRVITTSGIDITNKTTISGLRLTGGSSGSGGAVFNNAGVLTLSSVEVTGSSAGDGGGIFNGGGRLNLVRSTVAGNTASNDDSGGGIAIAGGSASIRSSTITGNSARGEFSGGGVNVYNGSVAIANSTVAKNIGPDHTDSFVRGAANLMVDAAFSGGDGANIQISSSIVADPLMAGSVVRNCDVSANGNTGVEIADQGFSLSDDSTCDATYAGTEPQLSPLANYGGHTRTMAIAATSPAIDAGKSGIETTDQRGQDRTVDQPGIPNAGDGADVGAYERALPPPPIARTLTIVYRPVQEAFTGKINSSRAACISNQVVTVWKRRPGDDLVYGRPTTNATGNYRLERAAANGVYYATVPRKKVGTVDCAAATSATTTVP